MGKIGNLFDHSLIFIVCQLFLSCIWAENPEFKRIIFHSRLFKISNLTWMLVWYFLLCDACGVKANMVPCVLLNSLMLHPALLVRISRRNNISFKTSMNSFSHPPTVGSGQNFLLSFCQGLKNVSLTHRKHFLQAENTSREQLMYRNLKSNWKKGQLWMLASVLLSIPM